MSLRESHHSFQSVRPNRALQRTPVVHPSNTHGSNANLIASETSKGAVQSLKKRPSGNTLGTNRHRLRQLIVGLRLTKTPTGFLLPCPPSF
jgi:hypothetical protein